MEVQAETEVMIPDTMRRLAKAVDDLRGFIVSKIEKKNFLILLLNFIVPTLIQ